MFACERFNQYTYGRKVFIKVDHKPLKHILSKPLSEAPPRIQRLLIRLQKYQVEFEYIPGKELHIADTLSRAHLSTTSKDSELNDECDIMIHTLIQDLPVSAQRLQQLKQETANDKILQTVTKYVQHG